MPRPGAPNSAHCPVAAPRLGRNTRTRENESRAGRHCEGRAGRRGRVAPRNGHQASTVLVGCSHGEQLADRGRKGHPVAARDHAHGARVSPASRPRRCSHPPGALTRRCVPLAAGAPPSPARARTRAVCERDRAAFGPSPARCSLWRRRGGPRARPALQRRKSAPARRGFSPLRQPAPRPARRPSCRRCCRRADSHSGGDPGHGGPASRASAGPGRRRRHSGNPLPCSPGSPSGLSCAPPAAASGEKHDRLTALPAARPFPVPSQGRAQAARQKPRHSGRARRPRVPLQGGHGSPWITDRGESHGCSSRAGGVAGLPLCAAARLECRATRRRRGAGSPPA